MAFSTCLLKGSVSDGISQKSLEKAERLDFARNARFSVWSGAYCGAVQHWIYNVLYARLFPGSSALSKVCATVFDGAVHAPFFYLPSYFTAKSWMTGGSLREGWDEYLRTKWNVLPAYYKVWTPATFGILFFVPPHFRVLALSAISLFWLVILSFKVPMVPEYYSSDD